jgi:xanthine dehydrogenase accessory factor
MSDWLSTLVTRLDRGYKVVRVVVSAVRGSAPREPGASMLVDTAQVHGTIGGGQLEWKAIEIARGMLDAPVEDSARVQRFVLGATLGQCCGGAVELRFERIVPAERELFRDALASRAHGLALVMETAWLAAAAPRRVLRPATAAEMKSRVRYDFRRDAAVERIDLERAPLWLFGAGHVGRAIVRAVADLPFEVTWVDERADIFPAPLPGNASARIAPFPVEDVADAPPGAIYLVLTHRHDLDFELCRAILERGDARWAGVIGSNAKAASFRKRLARRGVAPARIARLVSPIGVEGVASKLPAAIAVAVAAQLLQVEACAAVQSLPAALAR